MGCGTRGFGLRLLPHAPTDKGPEENMALNQELLSILACPRCRGDLVILPEGLEPRADGGIEGCEGLYCPACAVVYPVREDIPVMLIEEALPKEKWDETKQRT